MQLFKFISEFHDQASQHRSSRVQLRLMNSKANYQFFFYILYKPSHFCSMRINRIINILSSLSFLLFQTTSSLWFFKGPVNGYPIIGATSSPMKRRPVVLSDAQCLQLSYPDAFHSGRLFILSRENKWKECVYSASARRSCKSYAK